MRATALRGCATPKDSATPRGCEQALDHVPPSRNETRLPRLKKPTSPTGITYANACHQSVHEHEAQLSSCTCNAGAQDAVVGWDAPLEFTTEAMDDYNWPAVPVPHNQPRDTNPQADLKTACIHWWPGCIKRTPVDSGSMVRNAPDLPVRPQLHSTDATDGFRLASERQAVQSADKVSTGSAGGLQQALHRQGCQASAEMLAGSGRCTPHLAV